MPDCPPHLGRDENLDAAESPRIAEENDVLRALASQREDDASNRAGRIRTVDLLTPSQAGRVRSPAKSSTYDKPVPDTSTSTSSQEQIDPDLAVLIDRWPTLPAAVKAGIVAMVEAAAGG